MNRNNSFIFALIIVVLGIVAFVYYKDHYFPKYRWYNDFSRTSDQPYGLKLFYNVVKDQGHATTIVSNQSYNKLDTNQTNSNFISVGHDFYFDSLNAMTLLKFVEKGNHLLISGNFSPLQILRNFIFENDTIYGFKERRDSIISVDFTGSKVPYPQKLSFHYQYLKDTVGAYWSYYSKNYFWDTLTYYDFKPLSLLSDSSVNSFYFSYGKGKIIVHSMPLLFTNYYMVRKNGFAHANNLLSQLHNGPVYWDDPYTRENYTNHSDLNNPIRFLFSHTNLKWAWYLFLVTVLLYLIFRSKREQRIIPVMPVNTNTSIEFAKAIGTLYFQNKGQNSIANEMYFIFLSDIRSRYHISTDIPEAELIEQLVAFSGVDKTFLYHLFRQFKHLRTGEAVNENELINLYESIEKFNKKRK